MNTSQSGGVSGDERRALGPPAADQEESSPPVSSVQEVTPHFQGPPAALASLEAQLDRACEDGDVEAEGRFCASLARTLARRGAETREMLGLAERALARGGDGALAGDLSGWWVGVGDPVRGARVLQKAEAHASPAQRAAILTRIGVLLARAGDGPGAAAALERAAESDQTNPLPCELLGMLSAWDGLPADKAAQAFTKAAERHVARGEGTAAFEDCIRAFEASPGNALAAERLELALRERGREGAAEEVLREHARAGSASRRAGIHQRRFHRALEAADIRVALGAGLDAELDVALDPDRLGQLLRGSLPEHPSDFESLLLHLGRQTPELLEWLLAALDCGVSAWGPNEVQSLRSRIATELLGEPDRAPLPQELSHGGTEILRRETRIRELLLSEQVEEERLRLRAELARLAAARGAWRDAHEAIGSLIGKGAPLPIACLAAVISVRAREPETRARALLDVARAFSGSIRAVVAAIAAELLLDAGFTADAAVAVDLAVEADPSWQRGIAAQALLAQRDPDASTAAVLERSLAVVLARTQACAVLAESSERRGALRLALTWTQRQLSLRPGNPSIARQFLRRAVLSGDGEKLADGLAWLLSQPIPTAELTEAVASSLRALSDLAPERAAEAAKRALDVIGPRSEELRQAVIDVAEARGDRSLGAQVVERWIVSAPHEDRSELLLDLARRRSELGDATSAARAFGRALDAGAPPELVLFGLDGLLEPEDSDAIVAVLTSRARAMAALAERSDATGGRERAEVLRRLGAALWDLADNQEAAVRAWFEALDFDEAGEDRLARDLLAFAGPEQAARNLERAAETQEGKSRGLLLGLAAHAALDAHQSEDAFRLARSALEENPQNADVLAVAELAASLEQVDALDQIYDRLAKATLGRFGERAVHYRAAQQMEKRGHSGHALRHAISAFESVPAEGVSFVLMARLADRASDSESVVRAIERVAASASDNDARALWLERAAALADTSEGGRRQRVDVLLRALAVRPEAATLSTLSEAIRQLFEVAPEDRNLLSMRFQNALDSLLPKVAGPSGAQFAILGATTSLSLFGDATLALRAIRRGAECDGELPAFEELLGREVELASAVEAASKLVGWGVSRATQKMASMGRPLAEVLAGIASELNDSEARCRLLVRAAQEEPEDEALVRAARDLAARVGDADLISVIEALLPADERALRIVEDVRSLPVDDALDRLLEIDLEDLGLDLRALVLEHLAVRQEEIGRLKDAEASYRHLEDVAPINEVALAGLERAAERDQDYEELCRVLGVRADAATSPAESRRLRVRRASLLEKHLGRPGQAREELEELLEMGGEDLGALTLLADLCARGGDPARAAGLWSRAAQASQSTDERAGLLLSAAQAHLDAGDPLSARRALERVDEHAAGDRLFELRVAVLRRLGDTPGLADALERLAEIRQGNPPLAGGLLLEAAQCQLTLGETDRAAWLAARAAEATPEEPEAQLLARRLEYKERGAGGLEAARETVRQLHAIDEGLTSRQAELRAFLLAEALDVAEGGGAGRAALEAAVERLGARPLVSVALAERLDDDPARALELLDSALGADLRGLRSEGQILIRAGSISRQLGERDRAQAYLSAVSAEDPRQPEAAAQLGELALERKRLERDAQAKREQAAREAREAREAKERAEREERERAERERERREREARERAEREREEREERKRREREERERNAREARERAERERAEREAREREERQRKARERAEREAREREERERDAREREERERAERAAHARTKRAEREQAERDAREAAARAEAERAVAVRDAAERAAADRAGVERPQLPSEPAPTLLMRPKAPDLHSIEPPVSPPPSPRRDSSAPPHPLGGEPDSAPQSQRPSALDEIEMRLVAALEGGDTDAGRELVTMLQPDSSRTRDLVLVTSRLASFDPGDGWVLQQLAEAAERDRDRPRALAARHLLGAFGAGPPVAPVPVSRLREQPEAARTVLYRGTPGAAAQATALVWESAPHAFKRDMGTYGITGLERVPPGAPTPLGSAYGDAARLFGMSRTPLFQRRGGGAITMAVALLVPPALVISGEVDEVSPELTFHLGAMLLATAPEHALLFGADPSKVRTLFEALLVSFGPPCSERPSEAVTRLAALLWESIPPRGQRRLSQLCEDPSELSYEMATARARQVLRHAGLLLCGDIGIAVAATCAEERLEVPRTLDQLAQCCRDSDAVRDLVHLATTPEYAEVRWNAS